MQKIIDPEVLMLANRATTLHQEYVSSTADIWATSPFAWIKAQPSRRVGKIGEQLVTDYFAARNLHVDKAGDSDYDRQIEGLRAEIKFATLWESGDFVFQQIRDQSYDVVIALGLLPFDAKCWVIPKDVILAKPEGVNPQHTGRAGKDTLWLRFRWDRPPAWLDKWGGTLLAASRKIAEMARTVPRARVAERPASYSSRESKAT